MSSELKRCAICSESIGEDVVVLHCMHEIHINCAENFVRCLQCPIQNILPEGRFRLCQKIVSENTEGSVLWHQCYNLTRKLYCVKHLIPEERHMANIPH